MRSSWFYPAEVGLTVHTRLHPRPRGEECRLHDITSPLIAADSISRFEQKAQKRVDCAQLEPVSRFVLFSPLGRASSSLYMMLRSTFQAKATLATYVTWNLTGTTINWTVVAGTQIDQHLVNVGQYSRRDFSKISSELRPSHRPKKRKNPGTYAKGFTTPWWRASFVAVAEKLVPAGTTPSIQRARSGSPLASAPGYRRASQPNQ